MKSIVNEINDLIEEGTLEIAKRYVDPGVDQPKLGILVGNWNEVRDGLQEEAEELGYACEFPDEVILSNGAALITTPQHAWWVPAYVIHEGEIVTIEEPEDYLYVCAVTDHLQPITLTHYSVDPEDYGFVKDGKVWGTVEDTVRLLLEKFPGAEVVIDQHEGVYYREYK